MSYKISKTRERIQTIIVLISAYIFLSGCVAAGIHSTTFAVKAVPRHELKPKAEAGDANAQYELGKSYCCMGPGFDTQTATVWLCKAANQNDLNAMYELGRIYMGNVSRSPAPGQKVRQAFAKEEQSIAYVWLSRAADAGHANAQNLFSKLAAEISPENLVVATGLQANWPDVPCEYNDVFSS